jgi:hypothetical protein
VLSLLSQAGDLRGIALAHAGIAALRTRHHDTPGAADEYEQALAIFRDVGDARSTANTLLALGQLYAATGNDGKARDHYKQSLATHQVISDRHGINAVTHLSRASARRHP